MPKFDLLLNSVLSAISEFSMVFLFIFSVLIARTLGPEDYGIFIFALSFGAIYGLIVHFGFQGYLAREIPLDIERGKEKFYAAMGAQIWLMIFSSLIMIPICLLLPKPMEDKLVVLLISLGMLFKSYKGSLRGLLRGLDRFHLDTLIVINERVVLVVLGILALIYSWGLITISIAFVSIRIIDFIISLGLVWAIITKPKIDISVTSLKTTIRAGWPFATMVLLLYIYNYSDTVMISLMRTNKDVGFYNIAYQIFNGSQLIPTAIAGSVLPLLTIHYGSNLNYVNRLLTFSTQLMFYVSFPVVLFCSTYAHGIIKLLYGISYIQAVPALQLIIWGIPIYCLSVMVRCAFVAAKAEKTYAVIFALSIVFNIILNIPMIYYFSFIGACISTIVTQVLVCSVLLVYLKKLSYQYNFLTNIWKPLLVSVSVYCPLYLAYRNGNHALELVVGFILIYLSIIYFFKLITIEDFRRFRIIST